MLFGDLIHTYQRVGVVVLMGTRLTIRDVKEEPGFCRMPLYFSAFCAVNCVDTRHSAFSRQSRERIRTILRSSKTS